MCFYDHYTLLVNIKVILYVVHIFTDFRKTRKVQKYVLLENVYIHSI